MPRHFRLVLTLLLFTFALSSEAAVKRVFDFDGTLVNDHGPDAAWRTDWILVRVDGRHTALQQNPAEPIKLFIPSAHGVLEQTVQHPPRLLISFSEYRKIRLKLAQEDGQLGALDPRKPFALSPHPSLRDQPLWILPGIYRLDPNTTYERYQMVGQSYAEHTPLIEDAIAAEKREAETAKTASPLKWEGPAFEDFQIVTSSKKYRNLMSINTARGMTREHLGELFARWVRAGKIKNHPDTLGYTLHSAGDPALFETFGRGDLEGKKVHAVRLEARQLLTGPFEKHEELAINRQAAAENKKELIHTLIVYEDDPVHATNIGNLMADLSMRGEFKFGIKFVLRQVDPTARSQRWPEEYTVFVDGIAYKALPDEIAQWTGQDCHALLSEEQK